MVTERGILVKFYKSVVYLMKEREWKESLTYKDFLKQLNHDLEDEELADAFLSPYD
jgi:sulfur carrier protein ThiS